MRIAAPRKSAHTAPDGGDGRAAHLLVRFREFLNIIGPTTVIAAFLIYFGYIATRARFEYFGVYLDMVNLPSQDLLLYGVEVVYIPAVGMAGIFLLAVTAHAAVTWFLTSKKFVTTIWSIAGVLAVVGILLMGRALLGILIPHIADTEDPPGQTPLAFALGPVLFVYSLWMVVTLLSGRERQLPLSSYQRPPGVSRIVLSRGFIGWYATPPARTVRRAVLVTVSMVFIAGMFWAVNSFAWGFGAGRAYADALRLDKRPNVLLETRERLPNLPPGVIETELGSVEGATFRYRYDGLRLLVESEDRLFLVPQRWTRDSRTIVVPYNDSVWIQLAPPPMP
jgi:hypothetical protein